MEITIILLVLSLLISLFFTAYYWRQTNKLKSQINNRTDDGRSLAEIELMALRSQMNPHFIFNALGSIQYFIQTQDTEKADQYLADFAMLIRLILESSKTNSITIQEEIKIVELYTKLEKMRFNDLFAFRFSIDKRVDQLNHIPPMIIQPFVENAINHGLYHLKGRKGILEVSVEMKTHNQIVWKIADNGIGRKTAEKMRKASHIPRGMELINERVQKINLQKDVFIEIDIADYNPGDQSKGTEVKISFEYLNGSY